MIVHETPAGAARLRQLEQLIRESGGLLNVDVVLREDLPAMAAAILDGDPRAISLIGAVRSLFEVHEAPEPCQPLLCRRCHQPVGDLPFAACAVSPASEAGTIQLVFAICHTCGDTHDTALAAAMEAVRRMRPDARPVEITHPSGGRA